MSANLSRSLSTGQAAKLCSVTPDAILKWIKAGRLPASRTAGGHYRVARRELEAFLEPQAVGACPPLATCFPRTLRCWEYLSDRGAVREACKACVVYRVRAAWCFEMREIVGHAQLFCGTSCEECLYYHRVRDLIPKVLVVSADERLFQQLQEQKCESLILEFARSAYEAATRMDRFHPEFVVVDQDISPGGWRDLVDCLLQDPRVPGLKVILAVSRSRSAPRRTPLAGGVAEIVHKPFALEHILGVVGSLPVETSSPAAPRPMLRA